MVGYEPSSVNRIDASALLIVIKRSNGKRGWPRGSGMAHKTEVALLRPNNVIASGQRGWNGLDHLLGGGGEIGSRVEEGVAMPFLSLQSLKIR